MFKTNPISSKSNLHNAKGSMGGGQSAVYLEDVVVVEMAHSILIQCILCWHPLGDTVFPGELKIVHYS